MALRHADGKVYTTEWEEIQYKHGNKVGQYMDKELQIVAQKLAERHIDAPLETHDKVRERVRDMQMRGHGDVVDESLVDEDHDMAREIVEGEDDEEFIMQRYRAARLKQMQELQQTHRFGRLKPINGASYVQEITDASKDATVVGVLAEQKHEGCNDLASHLEQIAASHPDIKFVTCKSTEAIPNFPQKHLPCVVIYSKGQLTAQVTGMEPWCRTGTTKPTLETVTDGLRRLKVLPPLEESDEDTEEQSFVKGSKMRLIR